MKNRPVDARGLEVGEGVDYTDDRRLFGEW